MIQILLFVFVFVIHYSIAQEIPPPSRFQLKDGKQNNWLENCPFPASDCGIKPHVFGALFNPVWIQEIPSRQLKPHLTINSLNTNKTFARLVTPVVYSKDSDRLCIKFCYLIHGEGVDGVSVTQTTFREKESNSSNPSNQVIYSARGHEQTGRWRTSNTNIHLRQRVRVRYALDIFLNPGTPGKILIKHWKYHSGDCRSRSMS